jgi:hypothetical protein
MAAKRARVVWAAAALVGFLAVSHTSPVEAQGKAAPTAEDTKKGKDEAKVAYKEAQKKFKADDFAGALPLYQKADLLFPGAAPKHKIAISLDKLGKGAEAVAAYQAFVDSAPGEKYADRVTEAKARIDALSATLPATVNVKVAPEGVAGVAITVDGKPVEGTELKLDAGEHTIAVTAEGHQEATEVVTVKGNEKRDVTVALTPAAKAAPPEPKKKAPVEEPVEEEGRSNVPAYVTLGIAGAGIVLGVVFGVQALGSASDFDDDPTTDNADDAERSALIADMSFGVALTFGITGLVLLFSDDGGDDEEEEASAAPKLRPFGGTKGGGMAATWTF